jgi:glucose-1-phosphate adenylyltransferase
LKDVLGIVHHLDNEHGLADMTKHRGVASIPFGGKYCLIDFVLSNMVNANFSNVGVMTAFNLRSLLDHLGIGKPWGLDRKEDGLFILPSSQNDNDNYRRVDLEDFYVNLDYLHISKQKHVLISGSNCVANIDYQKMLNYHQKKQADITVLCKKNYEFQRDPDRDIVLELNRDGRVLSALPAGAGKEEDAVSLDGYLMEKQLLFKFLRISAGTGKLDLVTEILPEYISQLRIYGYPHAGYAGVVHSVKDLFDRQMDLLKPEVRRDLFEHEATIYTNLKDGPPTRYYRSARVVNSMVDNGCQIYGHVENSILFQGVTVAPGAVVRNCVVTQNGNIEEDASLEYVIMDKYAAVAKGRTVSGFPDRPLVVGKFEVVE